MEDYGSGGVIGREGEGVFGVFEGCYYVFKVFVIRVGGFRVFIFVNWLVDGCLCKGC